MRHQRLIAVVTCIALVAMLALSNVTVAGTTGMIGINVLLKTDVTKAILTDLGTHGTVRGVLAEIKAVAVQAKASELAAIQALPYVASANPDAARSAGPISADAVTDFTGGISTWDLDAINVTNLTTTGDSVRTVAETGSGVYVAVLDTGLVNNWPYYFPAERIATQYAICFGGGGGEQGSISTPTNKWTEDQNSHGTHVTSTILGYNRAGVAINGVAPMATVIPVKVLNQNGSGWSSVVAAGITYVGDLKAGALKNSPVVINMSLGGPELDAMEKAAIDYAIEQGVIIVASAGNEGEAGMGYPGAYAPVISVAASGWVGEWLPVGSRTWWLGDVADPTNPDDFYITDFSSRAINDGDGDDDDQDLDVAAPGSWVVGPYQTNGQINYYFLGGTSMASPHVAGIVALMAQKNPTLTAGLAETILENSAVYLAPNETNGVDVYNPDGSTTNYKWGADATGAGLATADGALKGTPDGSGLAKKSGKH
jgi:subtilisin family serine protease